MNKFYQVILLILLTIVAIAFTTVYYSKPSHGAETFFFDKKVGENLVDIGSWRVIGRIGIKDETNAACAIYTAWPDGSVVFFVIDLIDGEFYIDLKNNEWNLGDPKGKYTARLNLYFPDNRVIGGDMEYSVTGKNSVMFRWMSRDVMKDFIKAKELRLVMPGNIPNVTIPLANFAKGMDFLGECLSASKKQKLEGVSQPNAPRGSNI